MEHLKLHLLGSFRLDRNNTAVTGFHSDKVRAVLAYLVLETGDGPVRRDVLTSLLWDGYTTETARHSVRTALYNLRQLCAPLPLLETSRQDVRFNRSHPGFWCDALALEALLHAISSASDEERASRRAAWLAELETYQAEFLEGLNVPDSPGFEAWKTAKRVNYAERVVTAYKALMRGAAKPLPGLPRSLTPFFGREQEIKEIAGRVVNPDYPLITIIGEGGIGKTRLALEVARHVSEHFVDGVWFVPLVDVTMLSHAESESLTREHEFDRLAIAIGHAVQMSFANGSPTKQLFDHLRDKELLLVLDNFEHLVAATSFVIDLLQTAQAIKLLVTSRERLNLQMEWIYRLQGLPVPESTSALLGAPTLTWAGGQLFAERAARRLGGAALSREDWPYVVDICRSVEGLPLAIELAAAAIDHRSCSEIAQAVHHHIDALATEMHDVPARHRSLRAVFNHSWHLLSYGEAQLLAQCSVFRGGFDRQAAAIVATSPADLAALRDKSLLREDEAGRWDMHPLIRQLAAEGLATGQYGARQQILDRHSAYYLRWVGDQEAAIFRNDKDTLFQVQLEFENIRQAWEQALAADAVDLIDHSMIAIYEYCHLEGLAADALTLFAAAVEYLRQPGQVGEVSPKHNRDQILSSLLALQASFLDRAGHGQEAEGAVHEALHLAHTPKARTLALLHSAELLIQRSTTGPQAVMLLEEALVHARAWSHPVIEAMVLHRLGNAYILNGNLSACIQTMQQALQAYTDLGDGAGTAAILVNLGFLSLTLLDDLDAARRYNEQALQLQEATGNRQIEIISRINLSAVRLIEGRFLLAMEQASLALALATKLRHRRFQAMALECLGQACAALGDFAQADAYYGESLAIALAFGHSGQQAEALKGRMNLRLSTGDYEAVRELAEELHRLAAESLPIRFAGIAWCAQGHVHFARHELAAAAGAYQEAVQAYAAASQPYLQMEPLAGLAEIALAEGHLADAVGYVERILEGWKPARLAANSNPEQILLTVYRVLLADGDPRAEDIKRQAQAFLHERADPLPDAAMRQRYLEATNQRREIMRLA